MDELISVAVCARRVVWAWPEAMAKDQYMPDAGAGVTLGDVSSEGNGGHGIYGPRFDFEEGRPGLIVAAGEAVVVAEVGVLRGLSAMAEVNRKAKGRRWSPFVEG